MLPCFVRYNVGNRTAPDAIFICQCLLRYALVLVACAYNLRSSAIKLWFALKLYGYSFGVAAHPVLITALQSFGVLPRIVLVAYQRSPALAHFFHVLFVCAKSQMIEAYTRWIVALMQDEQLFWFDWAIGKFISPSVCQYIALAGDSYTKDAIAALVFGTKPYPAIASAINFLPKFIGWRKFGSEGIMIEHDLNLLSGLGIVMPPAVRAARGLRVPLNYSTNAVLPQWGAL